MLPFDDSAVDQDSRVFMDGSISTMSQVELYLLFPIWSSESISQVDQKTETKAKQTALLYIQHPTKK